LFSLDLVVLGFLALFVDWQEQDNFYVCKLVYIKSYKINSASYNRVTLTFDLLSGRSMRAERMSCTLSLPSLVLIAQAVFLLEHGHTDT